MKKLHLSQNLIKISLGILSIILFAAFGFKNAENIETTNSEILPIENSLIPSSSASIPVYNNWKNFTIKDGLPSNKVYCVKVDGDRVWAGTDAGLALYEGGSWTTYTTEDGLAHRGVLGIDVSELSGDVWIATFSGLNRFSGGKFETFNQFNSGMPNDVIYQVVCDGKDIWVATGGGAGRYDTYTKQWSIFTEQNAPMHEPWTYGITAGDGKVYIAAWGGGVIEFDKKTNQFRDYVDPDGEMELDLFPDDGVVHDITTGVSYSENILWVGTYFGLSRYDGTRWKGYFDHDSGLPSNFINFLKANGPIIWLCTDNGLSSFNGDNWITYKPNVNGRGGEIVKTKGTTHDKKKVSSSIAHNFVLGVDFQGEDIWVATSKGIRYGKIN